MIAYRLSLASRSDLQGIVIYLAPAPQAIRTRIPDQFETAFNRLFSYPILHGAQDIPTILGGRTNPPRT